MNNKNSASQKKMLKNDMRRQYVLAMVLVAVIPLAVLSIGLYYFNVIPLLTSFVNFNKTILDKQLVLEQVASTQKFAERLNNFFLDLEVHTSILSGIVEGLNIPPDQQQQMIQKYFNRFHHIRWMCSFCGIQAGVATPAMQETIERALKNEIELKPVGNKGMEISEPLWMDDLQKELFLVVSTPGLIDTRQRDFFLVHLPTADYLLKEEPFEGSIIVVDEEGRIVMQTKDLGYDLKTDFTHTQLVSDFVTKGVVEKKMNFRGMDNVMYSGVLSRVDAMDWGLITQKKPINLTKVMLEMESAALTMMKRLILALFIGLIFVGLLAGSTGALVALRFTKPLQNILSGINVIAQGDFTYKFDMSGPEDIKHLKRTLNSMIDSLQFHTQELSQSAENIKKMLLGSVSSLVAAIDAKDPYTRGHSRRVQNISVAIGKQMGLTKESLDELEISALMHDVGKLGIKEDILSKPSILTPEERSLMELHPVLGGEIVCHIPMFRNMMPGILYHHERWNGSGYPEALIGMAIPLYGRIVAVADTFDAMTSARPYQDVITHEDAKEKILEKSGVLYDPVVVQAFIDVFEDIQAICNNNTFSMEYPQNSNHDV